MGVAVGEDVDSDHIHKCKWHLISQILPDLYGVWHGCTIALPLMYHLYTIILTVYFFTFLFSPLYFEFSIKINFVSLVKGKGEEVQVITGHAKHNTILSM